MGSKSKGSLPAGEWNASGFFREARGQQLWGPDSARDPACPRCCTRCPLVEHVGQWLWTPPPSSPHTCRFVCARGCWTRRGQQRVWLIPRHQKKGSSERFMIYPGQRQVIKTCCQIIRTAFSIESTSKFNTSLHSCAPGPMSIAIKSSILLHNKAHLRWGLSGNTQRWKVVWKMHLRRVPYWPRASPLWQVMPCFSKTDTFWTHKTSLSLQGTARPLPHLPCPTWLIPLKLVPLTPAGRYGPEPSGEPFWFGWQWPRPYATPWPQVFCLVPISWQLPCFPGAWGIYKSEKGRLQWPIILHIWGFVKF